jgi:transcriptional regulator with GAF, ATPase, and Fis domain
MELLISSSKVLTSDMDLSNAVHLVFDMFQQKVNNNAMCILFLANDNAQLRVFAKDFFSNSKLQFISDKTDSVIWSCYKEQKEYIYADMNILSESDKKIFEYENIKKLINIPLNINNTDKYCVGVFCVGIKDEKYFEGEILDILREISRCFSILIFHRENYLKIKERNRKLEMEVQNVSNELLNKNTMLIQKVRTINSICDILDYSLTNFDLEDVVSHIIEKMKQLFIIETAGIFIYNTKNDEFYTVGGSFGINSVIRTKNKSKSFLNEVVKTKRSVVIKAKTDLQKYSDSDVFEQYLNVKSVVATPILNKSETIAVLVSINKTGLDFSENDIKTLEQLAIIIFDIIEKIKLYNILKDKEAED